MKKIILFILIFYNINFAAALTNPNHQWAPSNMFLIDNVSNVVMSPDGRSVAFLVTKFRKTKLGLTENNLIKIANLQTHRIEFTIKNWKKVSHLKWSPKGKYLDFLSKQNDIDNIYSMSLANHIVKKLTNSQTNITLFH